MVHQYQLNGYNIVLDTCSGGIHVVDEVAYDIIALYPDHTADEIVSAMMEKYGGRTNLEMDFFGGEPLMNWDVVKQLVEYARSVEKERCKNFCFTLTTNGRGFQYTGRVFRQKLVQAGMTQSMSRVLRVALTTIPWKASGIS